MDAKFVSGADLLGGAFKVAMRRLAATVTILTTTSSDGKARGMTATAVTSLSADPPSLLVCVNRNASIHPWLSIERPFWVNVLGGGHVEASSAFGGRIDPDERFSHGDWAGNAPPYLVDAQANFMCQVDALFEYASHTIVVGKIDAVRVQGDFEPLVYADGRFIPTRAPA
jgi:flavin reductase